VKVSITAKRQLDAKVESGLKKTITNKGNPESLL
jgi:hypothetical protein